MNYYPFHLGDYAAHTGHLDAMEDLAYRRMLDLYYLREAPLPGEPVEVARLIRMRPHVVEVESVLREFFTRTDDGWHQARCDEELERMQDKQAKARASAAASVNARRAKGEPSLNQRSAIDDRTVSDRSTDAELPTPTPTPTPTPNKVTPPYGGEAPPKRSAVAVDKPMATVDALMQAGFSPEVATEFIAHKAQAKAPLTDRAWRDHIAEAAKAGWSPLQAAEKVMAKNWKGFEAKYVANEKVPGSAASHMTFAERDALARRARWEEMTGRKWCDAENGDVIDVTPQQPRIAA